MSEFFSINTGSRLHMTTVVSHALLRLTLAGMYAIAHVGTTVQLDAIGMAKRAALDGADAIATVPPYYEKYDSMLCSA
jgi:dihydrodipicolinate synthase/N-acetylneuraminate lyase